MHEVFVSECKIHQQKHRTHRGLNDTPGVVVRDDSA
jgi:hypothetical protein